jgi:hypothetical protein
MSAFSLIFGVIGIMLAAEFFILWRLKVSQTVALTAAVDAAVAKLAEQKSQIDALQAELASVTPDTEVTPQVQRLVDAVNPPAQP